MPNCDIHDAQMESLCCGAALIPDTDLCGACRDHTEAVCPECEDARAAVPREQMPLPEWEPGW